jgi:outer membrane protein assembly factor BamB
VRRGATGGSLLACAAVLVACGGHTASVASTSEAASVGTSSSVTAPANASPPATASAVPDGDWPQFDFDSVRNGVGPARTGINPGDLGRLQRRTIGLDGTVDASVIALHAVKVEGRRRDVLVMTTSYGRTIALDAGSGRKLWEFVPPDLGSFSGSPHFTTATPTADPDRAAVYATAPDGIVRKLSLATGKPIWSRRVTFDPTHEKLASPPSIDGKLLVVVTDGYDGDIPPYQGHVVTINRASGRIDHVFNTLCSNEHHLIVPSTCPASDSAIFGRSGAMIEPGSGRILVATGNAPFNGRTDWGDSVLELSPNAAALLHNWTPADQAQLNTGDVDLGSVSPVLLPKIGNRRLAVQGGKDGQLKLLDLDRLDGTTGPAGPRLGGELQRVTVPGGTQLFAQPAVWSHAGRVWIFVADSSVTAAYVLEGGAGDPHLALEWSDSTAGTSPVLAGGLLYVYDEDGGHLNVLSPTSGHTLASLPAASGHWNSPIVVGGRIVLPVGDANDHLTSGTLYIYHLPGR